ncbi:MAG: YdcF family protein [Rhodobacteraceae bacterium]|nr:YdcF family protein [Paracoccaceae bacterium]
MIYLHKILPLIVSPLGAIFFLLLVSIIWKKRVITLVCIAFLTVFSLPVTSGALWKQLEADYPPRPIANVDEKDVVIVLSGMVGGFQTEGTFYPQWSDPDRFFAGLDLIAAGKGRRLLFTGGKVPWSNSPPEGLLLKEKAIAMGISPEIISISGEAENTAQEAQAIKALMAADGIASAVLVTSAFHMPRAVRIFEEAGIDVEPYATDYKAQGSDAVSILSFVPSAGALQGTSSAVREFIGRAYYALKAAI